jgi:hypothetical protein
LVEVRAVLHHLDAAEALVAMASGRQQWNRTQGQGLINVGRLQLRVSLQDPFAAAAAGDQPHDHADRDDMGGALPHRA